ncbi:MAG: S-methyl-5'-thioinosine phosphorylase [Gammaproteobacteria bacterium]|nr:S-methyl-5'-thioinosine phosphorylase [Gammaproteobacteria bacterium]
MLAIIGGSGLYALQGFGEPRTEEITTAYGTALVSVEHYHTSNGSVYFLPRHGKTHGILPHLINYRANIAALAHLGVREIIAVNVVGGIDTRTAPGAIILPNQIIDYTWGRDSTFVDENSEQILHVDFTNPFSETLGQRLLSAVNKAAETAQDKRPILRHGTYGCTQGPRLESAAEIRRIKRDGCDIVGMTGMPEAVLAREKGLDYAMLALSVNWAAGIVPGEVDMDQIQTVIDEGISFIMLVLTALAELTEPQ